MVKKTVKRRSKKRKQPKTKGGNTLKKCSPFSAKHKINANTCMTTETIKQIKQKLDGGEVNQGSKDSDILTTLQEKYNCKNDQCLLEKIHDTSLKNKIESQIFVPEKPTAWKKKPNEWLSDTDILRVLKQYETAFPAFRFMGPCPIDFATRVSDKCITEDICSLHLNSTNNKKQMGIVFNLDKHDEPGSHWVSMFIDIRGKKIYYFDSAQNTVPPEIVELKDRLIAENPRFSFFSNSVEHQKGNTECGMYSLYFIIQMLQSKNRHRLFHSQFNHPSNIATDEKVEKYRNVFFSV